MSISWMDDDFNAGDGNFRNRITPIFDFHFLVYLQSCETCLNSPFKRGSLNDENDAPVTTFSGEWWPLLVDAF